MCAIIGNPVSHSLSPVMHNAAFKELDLNFIYVAFNVKSKDLENAISGLKSMGFKGINVTMPHKTAVINYIDEIDSTTKSIGAINTIPNKNGYLLGYNTDGNGAMFALQENGIYIKGKNFTVRKSESEVDYSADVEKTFKRFKQGEASDYQATFSESIEMNDLEAAILGAVAQLYPEIFDDHQN